MSTHRCSRPAPPCVCALLVCWCVVAADARAGMTLPVSASGDVLVTVGHVKPNDFGAGSSDGIGRLNLSTGRLTTIVPPGALQEIESVVVGADGFLYIAERTQGLIRVDMRTHAVKPLGVTFGSDFAYNLTVEDAHHLLVGTFIDGGIYRVDLSTRQKTQLNDLKSLGPSHFTDNMVVAGDGTIYAAIRDQVDDFYRVDPRTGALSRLPGTNFDTFELAGILGVRDGKLNRRSRSPRRRRCSRKT